MEQDIAAINEKTKTASAFVDPLFDEIGKTVVGRRDLMERMVMAMLCKGHVLLEGVPGLAKTLAVNTMAKAMKLDFGRIQFTPDLLPADLLGTQIYDANSGQFSIKKGPLFTNIVLADEINRAPAKVQSALLESMQEKQVTIGGQMFKLEEPFMVLATQNPIEQEGTYQLPEAQVDRFIFKLMIQYPSRGEEMEIVKRMSAGFKHATAAVIGAKEIETARTVVEEIYVDDKIYKYIVDIVFASRHPGDHGLKELNGLIEYGASPRASIYLASAARAHAFLRHRGYVVPDDIKAVSLDVLRHRVVPTYEAEAENLTSEDMVKKIMETVPVP